MGVRYYKLLMRNGMTMVNAMKGRNRMFSELTLEALNIVR